MTLLFYLDVISRKAVRRGAARLWPDKEHSSSLCLFERSHKSVALFDEEAAFHCKIFIL
jgi:hypothetical protein